MFRSVVHECCVEVEALKVQITALRTRVVNLIDPAMTGVEVKQAVLDLLSDSGDSGTSR